MNLRALQENQWIIVLITQQPIVNQGDDSTTIIRLHHTSPYVDLLSSLILKCHRSNIMTCRKLCTSKITFSRGSCFTNCLTSLAFPLPITSCHAHVPHKGKLWAPEVFSHAWGEGWVLFCTYNIQSEDPISRMSWFWGLVTMHEKSLPSG